MNPPYLVIVESPGKAKTIHQILGKDYVVMACYGHVYDLQKKRGVDVNHDFAQPLQLIAKNKKHLDALSQQAKRSGRIFLATDPDREGEAIAAHLQDHLHQLGIQVPMARVAFNQITKSAILSAIEAPREVNFDLVDAQKARRGLDYLVGFNLSPLLWRKIHPGLSAGRVQSPALRMIAEREQEIRDFKPQEYWDLWAQFQDALQAKLVIHQGEKLSQFSIPNQASADHILSFYRDKNRLEVTDIKKKKKYRKPHPAFQTSTLQQESSKQLGFSATRTMSLAQMLYEGIDIKGERKGLITYMRTDSSALAEEAIREIRSWIEQFHGASWRPEHPRIYNKVQKNAQEAHEGIRPIDVRITPKDLQSTLPKDAWKLYELIWKRTIASQMQDAEIEQQAITLTSHQQDEWRMTGQRVLFPGFLILDQSDNEDEQSLPATEIGESWDVQSHQAKQHFTEAPPRFTEASLIKALEEYGIGRPSTYATIPSTLVKRDYVVLEKKRFQPTPTGEVVSQFLVNYFSQYVDYDFTAGLENALDDIAQGTQSYVRVMSDFWVHFHQQIQKIQQEVSRNDVTREVLEETCPTCEHPLCIKLSRNGRFIGCTNYPTCTFTRPLQGEALPEADHPCPSCQKPLITRHGRYGAFYGCSGYPACKHIESATPSATSPSGETVDCPSCKSGEMVAKKSRFNTIFYACRRYPECKYAISGPPKAQACEACAWPIVVMKSTKRRGDYEVCPSCQHQQGKVISSQEKDQ